MAKRVAIIGAGPSGLSALHAFETARKQGVANVPETVCFDRQADWGGQWLYSWRTGTDETGEPVHSSMYRYLWSNGPKECLEFSDYSFEEHYGKPIPSYPPREVLADYILGRVTKKTDVKKYIKFNTAVRWVEPRPEGGFAVSFEDLTTDTPSTEVFSHVIVATGHFWCPHAPDFEGIESFPGLVIHAHDFRRSEEYTGKNLLIVGGSYSAEDIGLQCMKYGAKTVTMSYRTQAQGFDWPEGMEELPVIDKFEGKTVHFSNGEKRDVDAIILCTGYKHHFPFLPDSLKLRTHNRLYSPGLFKGVVWNANPDVFYLGMQDQWFTFTMFDAEAWYARDVILGKLALPPAAEREADMAAWAQREAAATDAYAMIDFQAEYVRDLMVPTDYPKFDIDHVVHEFRVWKQNKSKSIVGYRDHPHKSAITGNQQPVHHTPWWNAMDDSLSTFLQAKM